MTLFIVVTEKLYTCVIIHDDSDIDFNILRTTNGVEITNNNDDNNRVSFVKQTPQHPKNRLGDVTDVTK